MIKTFKIHEENKEVAMKNIQSLNNKFAKHNIPLISYSWSDKDEFDCMELTVAYSDVPTISGVDYKYLGMVSYEEGSKFYHGFDENAPHFNTIRSMNCKCDMCKKEITNRTSFFVFEDKSNEEIKMFGSSCSKKAFPFNIEMYLNGLDMVFETLDELMEGDEDNICDGERHFGGKTYFDLDRVINALRTESNDFTCWISREKAEMEYPRVICTKDQVLDYLTKRR